MKKLTLFLATMALCAGMAMAQSQEPVKKTDNKVQTEQTQAAKHETQTAQKKHCGNCPHHQQQQCANKNTDVQNSKEAACKDNKACSKGNEGKAANKGFKALNKGNEGKACSKDHKACDENKSKATK